MANIIKTTLEDANDVLTYSNKTSFPSSGESGKLYIAADTKYTYFWNGSSYIETRGSGYASSNHTHSYISTLASINGNNTSTYPWRRIMSIPSTTANWKDVIGTYYLSGNYSRGPYYLFRVEFRANNSSNGELGSFHIKVIATNADLNNLAIASYSVATKGITTSYSDIFVKVDAWPRMTLTKLSAPDLGTIIYYDSNEGSDASSRTEAYAGINGSNTDYASYKLHSLSEYTFISYGELSASVKYASTSGSADHVPWGNVTDKPTSLKNPKALTFGSKTYDGSSAVELTAGDLGISIPKITATTSGSGNAVTDISATGHALTITKGSTFLTSHLYRPIQVNGTQILANNSSSALNLKTGSNIRMTNSNGTVTIDAANTTYSAGTGLSLSGTTFSVKTGYTTDANNRNYKVAADSSGNLYVNVPWSIGGTLDASLSSSSTNALQNKAIYSAFSSAVGYDNNYYAYGEKGSWRMRQYNATGNSLDIKYGVITINSQSANYSVSFSGKNFTSTNYTVVFGLYRSNAQSWFWSPIVQSKTASGFTVFLRGNSGGDNGGTIMYIAIRSN